MNFHAKVPVSADAHPVHLVLPVTAVVNSRNSWLSSEVGLCNLHILIIIFYQDKVLGGKKKNKECGKPGDVEIIWHFGYCCLAQIL